MHPVMATINTENRNRCRYLQRKRTGIAGRSCKGWVRCNDERRSKDLVRHENKNERFHGRYDRGMEKAEINSATGQQSGDYPKNDHTKEVVADQAVS